MKALTLVEILAIVTIVVILAALALPRFLMPREQVLAIEAQEFLNVMRLSQINVKGRGSSVSWVKARSYYYGEPLDSGWNVLGMKPLERDAPFDYVCDPERGTCMATRAGVPEDPKFGGTVTIDLDSGSFSCGAPYVVMSGPPSAVDPPPLFNHVG